MKRKLLILCACLFAALTGVKAYTVDDLTAAGWTQVSAISNDASNENYVGNFVYVLVDAGSSNYAFSGLTNSPGWKKEEPAYRTLANPFTTPYEVWTIEIRNDGYALRNIESQKYFNSNDGGTGEGWLDHMADTYENGSLTIGKDGSKYNIYGVSSQGYVGPWNGDGAVASDGEAIAANKGEGEHPDFYFYRMAKATYLRNYLKQCPNVTSPVDASYLIVNPTIYQGGADTEVPWGWNTEGEHVTDDDKYTDGTGNTKLRAHRKYRGNKTFAFNYFNAISSLPGGDYKVIANGNGTPNRVKSYLYIKISDNDYKNIELGSDVSDYETPYLSVATGNSIKLGANASGKYDTGTHEYTSEAFADNFRLKTDPYISTMATEFNNGVEMTAGLWYHFEVANTGNHILTATNLNDIIYATGENTALSAAGSSKFSGLQTLNANTHYYIRSSSNNTLTITPCISTIAEELPDNGAMTAGEWYYFDVATEGHYDVVASSITNIVYTTDGNLAEGASVASKFSVKNNNLTATRYYVKSSSAQTLQWFLTDEKDYTSYIKNPSFDDEISAENWTLTNSGTEGYYVFNRVAEGGVEEYNRTTIKCEQTITNLPNGIYKVTVQGYYRGGGGGYTGEVRNAKLFANDEEVDIMSINDYKGITEQPSTGNWTKINNSFYVPDNTAAANYAINTLKQYNNEVMVAVSDGTLTIGVKKDATVGNDWTYFDNFTLTYTGPYNEVVESGETQTYEGTFTENVVVTPTAEYPIVNISGASFTGTLTANFTSDQNGFIIATAEQKAALGGVKNVVVGNTCDNLVLTDGVKAVIPTALTTATTATYSRTIGASTNFGTICVPFALESNDDIQYYTVKSISDGVLTLVETSIVDAGVPAVYKKKGAYAEATNIVIESSDADVEDEAGTQGATVKLIGTFTGLTVGDKDGTAGTAANGNYYIGTDNRFYQGANYITVNPFRAYITGSGENAARLTIQIEDENGTTSIVALEEFENENNLKDGKYLIDGKIVIVKNGVMYSSNGQILK